MVDERRIAILGAGKIGESLLAGLLTTGWRKPRGDRRHRPRRGADDRARRAPRRHGDALELGGGRSARPSSSSRSSRRTSTPCSGRSAHSSPRPDRALGRRRDPGPLIEQRLAERRTGRERNAEHTGDGARGRRGRLRRCHAGDEHLALAQEVLGHVGSVVRVPEPYMDAVTAVSGPGPAYFALLAEAMIEAGILLGLSREVTTTARRPDDVRDGEASTGRAHASGRAARAVTSPGGTTIVAIREHSSTQGSAQHF